MSIEQLLTITVHDLKQVLIRYGFLIPVTLVSVPKLPFCFSRAIGVEGKKNPESLSLSESLTEKAY